MAHDYSRRVDFPDPKHVNGGLSYLKASTMLSIFGKPRVRLTSDCMPVTNPKLRASLVTMDVGPFRVYALRFVCEKLKRLFEKVEKDNPELYKQVGSAGGVCCRHIRGVPGTPSNHAFGGAVDLTINGELDAVGDGKCQEGLLVLYPYFHNEGFYWGGEFKGPREDSMHYEIANETAIEANRKGLLVAR